MQISFAEKVMIEISVKSVGKIKKIAKDSTRILIVKMKKHYKFGIGISFLCY